MTSQWEEMWRKPFYDEPAFAKTLPFYDNEYVAINASSFAFERAHQPSTTTTEYRSVGITVWHEEDSRHGDMAWAEREGKA